MLAQFWTVSIVSLHENFLLLNCALQKAYEKHLMSVKKSSLWKSVFTCFSTTVDLEAILWKLDSRMR